MLGAYSHLQSTNADAVVGYRGLTARVTSAHTDILKDFEAPRDAVASTLYGYFQNSSHIGLTPGVARGVILHGILPVISD